MLVRDILKGTRESIGLSVADAAKQVRIDRRSWQRYESGDRKPPEGLLELFCLKNGLDYEKTFVAKNTNIGGENDK
jgi:transcriptional regulator with XRE-family HTH domain